MKSNRESAPRRFVCALLAIGALALATPVTAEHRKQVDGFVINIGVVPTAPLLRVDAYERVMHGGAAANATHHVVVGVADARTGEPIADARVMLEVIDPHGGRQKAMLEAGRPGGYPDYSGLVRFGWSGQYQLRVDVARAGAAPVSATFAWTQDGY